jgi:hypothetical protein
VLRCQPHTPEHVSQPACILVLHSSCQHEVVLEQHLRPTQPHNTRNSTRHEHSKSSPGDVRDRAGTRIMTGIIH